MSRRRVVGVVGRRPVGDQVQAAAHGEPVGLEQVRQLERPRRRRLGSTHADDREQFDRVAIGEVDDEAHPGLLGFGEVGHPQHGGVDEIGARSGRVGAGRQRAPDQAAGARGDAHATAPGVGPPAIRQQPGLGGASPAARTAVRGREHGRRIAPRVRRRQLPGYPGGPFRSGRGDQQRPGPQPVRRRLGPGDAPILPAGLGLRVCQFGLVGIEVDLVGIHPDPQPQAGRVGVVAGLQPNREQHQRHTLVEVADRGRQRGVELPHKVALGQLRARQPPSGSKHREGVWREVGQGRLEGLVGSGDRRGGVLSALL